MCKLKPIEYNKDATEGHSMIIKTEYIAKTEDDSFEAVVTVFQFKETPAYVGKFLCRKGGDKLQGYVFWDNLQIEVLKFHKQRMANEFIMNTVDLDAWCDDGSDPGSKKKK